MGNIVETRKNIVRKYLFNLPKCSKTITQEYPQMLGMGECGGGNRTRNEKETNEMIFSSYYL